MDWFDLLKQPKLRAGSKITTNLGTDSTPEDNHCLKKVLEYLEKMRNFGEVYNKPIIEFDGWITKESSDFGYFHMMEPFTCGKRDFNQRNSYLCNEKVACIVLKLLERLKSQGSGMFEEEIIDGDEVYFVEIVLESTKKLKTKPWGGFDDHQDAAFIILITSYSNDWEFYQITYESQPKNPNKTATGYKDYTEEDYKRMIKVLHRGVFG
tara:strand:+ start:1848 stop:2474 length:627 start_codon:yes stop_codon:yes gene_type:complete